MAPNEDGPVFIVGAPRSGTTLVHAIIASSGEFALYEAETMLLSVCKPKYGDIRHRGNFRRFLDDWMKSKQFFRSGLNALEFKNEVVERRWNYLEFLRYFMESISEKQDKQRWLEQTPAHLFHMKELSAEFDNARFIHVIRDGRDVALSNYRLGWTGSWSRKRLKQLLVGAFNWEIHIYKGQGLGACLGRRYMEIRYEDIVKDLDRSLEKLNRFVDADITIKKVRESGFGSLGRANTVYKDMAQKGISSRSVGRWVQELRSDEVNALNNAIGGTLRDLGYETDDGCSHRKYITVLPKDIYRIRFEVKRMMKFNTFLGRYTSDNIELGQK